VWLCVKKIKTSKKKIEINIMLMTKYQFLLNLWHLLTFAEEENLTLKLQLTTIYYTIILYYIIAINGHFSMYFLKIVLKWNSNRWLKVERNLNKNINAYETYWNTFKTIFPFLRNSVSKYIVYLFFILIQRRHNINRPIELSI